MDSRRDFLAAADTSTMRASHKIFCYEIGELRDDTWCINFFLLKKKIRFSINPTVSEIYVRILTQRLSDRN
jgi:hypothetical protein